MQNRSQASSGSPEFDLVQSWHPVDPSMVFETIMTAPQRRRTLGALFASHLAAGLASAYAVDGSFPNASVVWFLAIFLANASMIGLWAGLSERSPRFRLLTTVADSAYLMLLPSLTTHGYGHEFLLFAALATLSLLPGFLVATSMRRFGPKFRLAFVCETPFEQQPLQVSMRFLFAFTAAVAVMLMFFQSVQKHAGHLNMIAAFILPLSYGWIACVVVLAVLMPRKVVISTCAAIAVCPLVGAIPAYYLGAELPSLREPFAWAALAGADAAIIAATLLVVRWCGYRLVPQPTGPELTASEAVQA